MSLEYKIPRLLWENFEAVLLAQSKKYIKELANRLNVPEKELLNRVLPSSDSLKVIIQDSQSESNQCKAYIQQKQLTIYCRNPCVYGTDFCGLHRNKRLLVIQDDTNTSIKLRKIKDNNKMDSVWMSLSNNTLYNINGDIIGRININTGKIIIYVLEA
jgi:L-arabinose isomerase